MSKKSQKFRYYAVLLTLLLAQPVSAELNDPPYFNLWSGTGANGETGDLLNTSDSVSLCGTSACTADNTTKDWAIFRTVAPNYGKGSGAIDPFLRFQHNEFQPGSQTWEAAFNTDYRGGTPTNTGTIELDKDQFNPNLSPNETSIFNQAKDANAFNHSLMLGDLRNAIDSGGYFHFLLDINEPGNAKATLRLDELAFFVGATGNLHELTQDKNGTSGSSLATVELAGAISRDSNGDATVTDAAVWDMDFNGASPNGAGAVDINGDPLGGLLLDNINDSGPAGSGDYDLELLLSADLFANYLDTDYVYLYNFMGEADQDSLDEAEAGFEEWAFDTSAGSVGGGGPGGGSVPEPTSLALVGIGMAGFFARRKRRME